ncbi:MAG: copper chaperone PCu(A)C [Pseudomonadota bacterium]
MNRFVTLIAAGALLGACAPATAPSESGPVLSYTNAFVMAPIADRDMTMGGVSLSVAGGDVRLVGASSPSIGTIELHTMAMDNGTMKMRQVEGYDIASGETLALKRGSDHFMMFELGNDLVAGETVDITLDFDAGGTPMNLVIEADVRALGE